jgi:hypothetical protein
MISSSTHTKRGAYSAFWQVTLIVRKSSFPLASNQAGEPVCLARFLLRSSPLSGVNVIRLRRNIFPSVVVSAALVLGVVSPAQASGALPSGSPTTEPVTAVPPLATTKGTAPSPSGAASNTGVPSTGLVAASSPAPVTFPQQPSSSSYNPISSVPISYGSNDTIFQNADGSETKEVSPTPINFQKPDGSWVPAGTSVTANLQTGGFSVADNPLNPTFAATTANGAGFSVNSGSDPVSISLEGAATDSAWV